MVKLISFEGCIGAGKTTLTNYFAHKFKCTKLLEQYEKNPFLHSFYLGEDVKFETELTFLLIHYSQIKKALDKTQDTIILCDFSLEKDLVYAQLNLNKNEYNQFEQLYNYLTKKIHYESYIIYIDISVDILKRRIFQRGRSYEIDTDPLYFQQINNKMKNYFKHFSKSNISFYQVDDLVLDPNNNKLNVIETKLKQIINIQ